MKNKSLLSIEKNYDKMKKKNSFRKSELSLKKYKYILKSNDLESPFDE